MNNRVIQPDVGDMAMIVDGGDEHRRLEGHVVNVQRYASITDLWLLDVSAGNWDTYELARSYLVVSADDGQYLVKRHALIRIQPDAEVAETAREERRSKEA